MFKKSETEKQQAITTRTMKAVDAYLQQQRKLDEAFVALDAKISNTQAAHKEFLRKAGAIEAKRLLGEVSDDEANSLDASLIQTRDQQDRLDAATQALKSQKQAMNDKVKEQLDIAGAAMGNLAGAFQLEMEEELKQVAAQLTSIVDRLRAFTEATTFGNFNTAYLDLTLPSLIDGENLFRKPVTLRAEVEAPWRQNADAVKIYDQLVSFGQIYRKLNSLEASIERATAQAEREAEYRKHNAVAA